MPRELEDLLATIETWQIKRLPLAEEFSKDGLREFAAVHNAMTRKVMALTGKNDPEFWSAWMEIGQNASTMAVKGKLIVDKIDRTNL